MIDVKAYFQALDGREESEFDKAQMISRDVKLYRKKWREKTYSNSTTI
jgi:hypothetical protein